MPKDGSKLEHAIHSVHEDFVVLNVYRINSKGQKEFIYRSCQNKYEDKVDKRKSRWENSKV